MRIELTCLDQGLAEKIGQELSKRLTDLGVKTAYSSVNSTLMGRAIRLLKSYPTIQLDIQTSVLLESAREYQNHIENIKPIKDEDVVIIKAGSFIVYCLVQAQRLFMQKVLTRHLGKKIGHLPNFIVYLKMDRDRLFSTRNKKNKVYGVEENYKGKSIVFRNKATIKSLDKLNSKKGIKSSIIEVGDKSIDELVVEVVAELMKHKLIVVEES